MTTPNDLYAALCERFGIMNVQDVLATYRCEWRRDPAHGEKSLCCDFSAEGCSYTGRLPDPVALCVLESVGEAMLWEAEIMVHPRKKSGGRWYSYRGASGFYPTKSAAIIAALGGKE